jgi:hypothetical protein
MWRATANVWARWFPKPGSNLTVLAALRGMFLVVVCIIFAPLVVFIAPLVVFIALMVWAIKGLINSDDEWGEPLWRNRSFGGNSYYKERLYGPIMKDIQDASRRITEASRRSGRRK